MLEVYWVIPCPKCDKPIFAHKVVGGLACRDFLHWEFIHNFMWAGWETIGEDGDHHDPRMLPDWLESCHEPRRLNNWFGEAKPVLVEISKDAIFNWSVWDSQPYYPEQEALKRVLKLCGV